MPNPGRVRLLGICAAAALLTAATPPATGLADAVPVMKFLQKSSLASAVEARSDNNDLASLIPSSVWISGLGLDRAEHYSYDLIREESWSQWQAFQRMPGRLIPLASVSLMYKGGLLRKRPLVRRRRWAEAKAPKNVQTTTPAEQSPFSPPPMEKLLRKISELESRHGLWRSDNSPNVKGWRFANFLFAEEGVFSGRPWDWDNFLPRLLSVGAMVAAGLIFVELMRLIVNLGSKTLRGRDRKG